jgi:hypothetical protein
MSGFEDATPFRKYGRPRNLYGTSSKYSAAAAELLPMRTSLQPFVITPLSFAAAVAAAFAQPHPSDFAGVTVHRVTPSFPLFARVLFQVTNRSSRTLRSVEVNCTVFTVDEKPLGVGSVVIRNLRAGEADHGEALITIAPSRPSEATSAKCRVVSVDQ